MHDMAFEWWLRPVSTHERDGEHSAVVCMFVYSRPPLARRSRFGVRMGLP